MKISREEVLHISRLARIDLCEEEVETFRRQLSDLLGHFEVLQKVDTEGVPPTAQSINLYNVMREDKAEPSLPTEKVLENAPQRDGDFFRIHNVL